MFECALIKYNPKGCGTAPGYLEYTYFTTQFITVHSSPEFYSLKNK